MSSVKLRFLYTAIIYCYDFFPFKSQGCFFINVPQLISYNKEYATGIIIILDLECSYATAVEIGKAGEAEEEAEVQSPRPQTG
jgi:hypothetical protein